MLGLIGWSVLFLVFLKLILIIPQTNTGLSLENVKVLHIIPTDEHWSFSWEYKTSTYHSFQLNASHVHSFFKGKSHSISYCQNWIRAARLLFANQSIKSSAVSAQKVSRLCNICRLRGNKRIFLKFQILFLDSKLKNGIQIWCLSKDKKSL